ncbi:MAG: phosphate/phosphite/phosphonate ABC transporter substrate-binding protein [Deltaproteobacteria bacterium]|nr:phosphate/phosphite/phosphonate ABC transporter substrate-binding protein [Deltaproteobacteria bacterium]
MKKYLFIFILSANVFLFNLIFTNTIEAKELKLVVPLKGIPIATFTKYKPLIDYLFKKTEHLISIKIADNPKELLNMLKSGEADFGFCDSIFYAIVSKDLIPLAVAKRNGKRKSKGVIIVLRNSKITNIYDLKGAKVSITSYTDSFGYYSQRLYLLDKGIDVDKDIKINNVEEAKPSNVILNVINKGSDAGFIGFRLYNRTPRIQKNKIKILAETTLLPNRTFIAQKRLNMKIVKKIKKALLMIRKDDKIATSLEIDGFSEPFQADYDLLIMDILKNEMFMGE